MNFIPLSERMERGEEPILRTWVKGPKKGTCQVLKELPESDPACYDEIYASEPKLYIMGGGHVGRAVCQVASFCGFSVTVMDPREELLTKDRFPGAKELRKVEYDKIGSLLPCEAAYYVVVTSGHEADLECVYAVLQRPFVYAGMMGSRRKVEETRKLLLEMGVAPEVLERLHAPIGIPIYNETPEEIAVSIAAQLIDVKNTSQSTILSRDVMKALSEPNANGVLCTIITNFGSVPREAGSKMFVSKDGRISGTVGGGKLEYLVQQHAAGLVQFDIQEYLLTPEESAGMACGGGITVMFQPILNE